MILLADGVLIQGNHSNFARKFVIMDMHTDLSLRPHLWLQNTLSQQWRYLIISSHRHHYILWPQRSEKASGSIHSKIWGRKPAVNLGWDFHCSQGWHRLLSSSFKGWCYMVSWCSPCKGRCSFCVKITKQWSNFSKKDKYAWICTPGNPHNPKRYTGGSSSGSVALVASGFCSAALGTDAGGCITCWSRELIICFKTVIDFQDLFIWRPGSVRIPASLCGVVGLKTTFGRTDLTG